MSLNIAQQFIERNGKSLFGSIKNSGEILNKLKSRGFLASGLYTYNFSTLYTTLPHNLIKEKLTELIEQTFNREGSLYLACNDKNAFFTSEQPKRYKLWSCQKMCDTLHYLLNEIGHWLDMVYPTPPLQEGILLTIFFLKPNVLRGFCNMQAL